MSSVTTRPPQNATTAPYNAYDGSEALRVVMANIYEQLKGHSIFGVQKTYERVQFDFSLTFKPYGHDPKKTDGAGTLELKPTDLTVSSSAPTAPDEGRTAAGLPIPGPKWTTAGPVDVIPKI